MQALEDDEWQVRGVAALALGQHQRGNEDVVTALVSVLADEQAPVRKAAVIALGNLGSLSVPASDEIQKLVNDDDAAVSQAAEETILKLNQVGG